MATEHSAKRRIAADLDWLCRQGADDARRLRNCRTAASTFATDVAAFLEDPDGVGTNALHRAYVRFLGSEAGNFNGPERAEDN